MIMSITTDYTEWKKQIKRGYGKPGNLVFGKYLKNRTYCLFPYVNLFGEDVICTTTKYTVESKKELKEILDSYAYILYVVKLTSEREDCKVYGVRGITKNYELLLKTASTVQAYDDVRAYFEFAKLRSGMQYKINDISFQNDVMTFDVLVQPLRPVENIKIDIKV
jgi:hypothetical protein